MWKNRVGTLRTDLKLDFSCEEPKVTQDEVTLRGGGQGS